MGVAAITGVDIQLLITAFLLLLFWTLRSHTEQGDFFTWWMWGWGALAVFLVTVRLPTLGIWDEGAFVQGVRAVSAPLALLQVPLFYLGAHALRHRARPSPRRVWGAIGLALLIGIVMGAFVLGTAEDPALQRAYRGVLRQIGLAVVFPYCAFAIVRYEATADAMPSIRLVAAGFFTWGANQLFYGAGSIGIITALPTGIEDYILSNWALLVDTFSSLAIGVGATLLNSVKVGETRRSLHASEDRFRHLVDNAGDAIFLLDAVGNFTEVNQQACESLGYTQEELLGMNVSEVEVIEPGEEEGAKMARAQEGRHATVPGNHRRKDGSTFPVQARVTRLSVGGEPRLLAVVRDITDERRRNERLRRAERMATLATLVGGVAHELNNPLTSIRGSAELMLAGPERAEDDREGLELIRSQADRAARIVADLKVVARETREGSPELHQPVDMNDVVARVLRLREYTYRAQGLKLQVSCRPGLLPFLGDRGTIEQVLINLLTNAEHAVEDLGDQGLISIRTDFREASVLLEIEDNGPGIPAHHLPRLFDPFFTTKSAGRGTGLGLSLVHGMVSEHGGQIGVQSEEGEGARFWVRFPAMRPGESGDWVDSIREVARLSGTAARPLKVLVVEDEAPVRHVVRRFLERRGHRVDEAADGAEALRQAELQEGKGGYDVVLTDVRMPGMDGPTLLEELYKRYQGERPRFVVMTGDATDSRIDKILTARDIPVLLKPFVLAEVARIVEG